MYFIWWCILGLCHEYLPGHVSVDSELGMTADKGSGLDLFLVGFPGGSDGKKKKKICLQCRRPGFDPWIKKIPWRREWLPTPVFLPAEFHGQSSLVGYSPWCHIESDTTEWPTWTLSLVVIGFQVLCCSSAYMNISCSFTKLCPTFSDPHGL